MQQRTPILALLALAAGLTVGLVGWLAYSVNGSNSELATTEAQQPESARAVGEPSTPFGGDTNTGDVPDALGFVDDGETTLDSAVDAGRPSSDETASDNETSSTPDIEAGSNSAGPRDSSSSNLGDRTSGVTNTNDQSSASTSGTGSNSTNITNSDDGQAAAAKPDDRGLEDSQSSPASTPTNRPTTEGASDEVNQPNPSRPAVPETPSPTTTVQRDPTPQTPTTSAPRVVTTEPASAAARVDADPGSSIFISTSGNDSNRGTSGAPVESFGKALELAEPGDAIVFQSGTYDALRITGVNGTSSNPIRIVGEPGVEFRSSSYSREAGILVRDSTNIEITDVSVRHALWGVYIQNSHGIKLLDSDIRDIGQEVVRIKDGSSNILVEGNTIADSGRRTDKGHANGEGVYIGTGTPSNVDHVSNVTVRNNFITRLTDEAIDIKIPSTNILIEGNTITEIHTQTSGAIVAHLNSTLVSNPDITIERNIVRDVTRSSPYRDGNCIVAMATVTIVNNVLHDCQHRGIFIQGSSGTATILHNTFIDTGELGTIVNDGRGQSVVSRNNLGTSGSENRQASSGDFTNPGDFDYRVTSNSFDSAPSVGVRDDLTGARRSSGQVTFGAVER